MRELSAQIEVQERQLLENQVGLTVSIYGFMNSGCLDSKSGQINAAQEVEGPAEAPMNTDYRWFQPGESPMNLGYDEKMAIDGQGRGVFRQEYSMVQRPRVLSCVNSRWFNLSQKFGP